MKPCPFCGDKHNSSLSHCIDVMTSRIEQLENQLEMATHWNQSVSVCKDHTQDIIDGDCVICRIAELEAKLGMVETAYNKADDDPSEAWYEIREAISDTRKPLAVVEGETIPKHIGARVQTILVAHLDGPSENYPQEVTVIIMPKEVDDE